MEDQLKGNVNEGLGKAKSAIGNATGDAELETKGDAQQGEGVLQKMVGDAKDKIGDAADSVKKAIHDHTN